jgi:hypothetical protein
VTWKFILLTICTICKRCEISNEFADTSIIDIDILYYKITFVSVTLQTKKIVLENDNHYIHVKIYVHIKLINT